MAVARRGDYGSSGGYPAGARLVFNVKPPSKLAAKLLCNDARRDIGDATGPKRQNDPHSFVRVFGLSTALTLRKGETQQNKHHHERAREARRSGTIED